MKWGTEEGYAGTNADVTVGESQKDLGISFSYCLENDSCWTWKKAVSQDFVFNLKSQTAKKY